MPIKRVGPGELITADFFNEIIDAINQLAEKVAALEGSGAAPASPRPKPKKRRK